MTKPKDLDACKKEIAASGLSPTQLKLFRYAVKDINDKMAAEDLGLSLRTVRKHWSLTRRKLGHQTRLASMAWWASRQDVITDTFALDETEL